MAVTPGSRILAAEYNSLQNRIATVLGNGTAAFGYGQPVSSAPVSGGTVVTADRLKKIRNDIELVYTHQTGNLLNLVEIDVGDVIGAAQSGTDLTFNSNGSYTFNNPDQTKGFLDYLTAMSAIEVNRYAVVPGQQEYVPSVVSDQRTGSWSYGAVTSEIEIRFSTPDARRHFFNSGGELEISGVINNLASGSPSYTRNLGWQQIIQNPGLIRINHDSVSVSNAGGSGVTLAQGSNYGNSQLTSAYAEIFRKRADAGVYTNSYWSISARALTASIIKLRVQLVDGGPESNLDGTARGSVYGGVKEPVTADIVMRYGGKRAAAAVEVPFPSFVIVNSFQ